MPIALATLFVMAAQQIGRVIGWVALAYAFLIFVGSIQLGWHYAATV